MRFLFVVIGVVVMVIGAVLLVIPTVASSPDNFSAPANTAIRQSDYVSGTTFSILEQQPITGSWTSNTSALVEIDVCSARCTTGNATNVSSIIEVGTSGSFAFDMPYGDHLILTVFGASGSAVHGTINFSTALTAAGSGALVVGIVLIVVGFLLKSPRRRPARAGPAPPRPATPRPPTITVEPSPGPAPASAPPK